MNRIFEIFESKLSEHGLFCVNPIDSFVIDDRWASFRVQLGYESNYVCACGMNSREFYLVLYGDMAEQCGYLNHKLCDPEFDIEYYVSVMVFWSHQFRE